MVNIKCVVTKASVFCLQLLLLYIIDLAKCGSNPPKLFMHYKLLEKLLKKYKYNVVSEILKRYENYIQRLRGSNAASGNAPTPPCIRNSLNRVSLNNFDQLERKSNMQTIIVPRQSPALHVGF